MRQTARLTAMVASALMAPLLPPMIAAGPAAAQEAPAPAPTGLMAGAARIDVTPDVDDLPAPLASVHDPLHVRALVVDSNGKRVVMTVADVPAIAPDVYADLLQRVAAEAGVPEAQVIMATTHTHNSMRVAEPGPSPIPTSPVFTAKVVDGTLEAVRQAIAALAPARSGYATGESSLVSGRNEWLAAQHRFVDGVDRSGTEAVDRSLGIQLFETADGKPLAAVLNFGIEPVIYEQVNTEVSGDIPGAVSDYVEDALGDGMVALFTIGAPATPSYRVWPEDSPERRSAGAARLLDAYGVMLGEEALARIAGIRTSAADLPVATAADSFSCPGKLTTPRNLRNMCAYTADSTLPPCDFKDAPFADVKLSLGMLKLGPATYLTADGNVVPRLWETVKAQSPFTNLRFVGTNFGPFRFVVDDRGYQLNTYPATDTRAQANCAEPGLLASVARMSAALE